ncbi:glycosyl transferase family 1 [Subtercola sp. Z020]|uniref:glycosyltransferase family 4 protein n=1 Tax=Subtercola sp. Z020 TaxID=2080582 RepID=UPI000CE8FF9C|nr:glycosyltransferase [Subtercola sp. Z020]PPF85567.1 glycosyl transferase family 1 [Subtercola sp. Z020]
MTVARRELPRTSLQRRVRLYESVRTAHLERAHELQPASILYRVKRYDFEDTLARGLHLVRVGPLSGALLIARSRIETLEINEPLMLSSLASTSLALLALKVRHALGGKRTTVVTYAIGNTDPFAVTTHQRPRTRLRRKVERRLARWVWNRVDRAAFGTSAAQQTYENVLGEVALGSNSLVIPALPAPAPTAAASSRVDGRVIFVGAFSERKGIRVLLDAWPHVTRLRPGATLTIMGKGILEDSVLAVARLFEGITVEIDPDRGRIAQALDEARVLVLPSQPSPTWREQVGLPIVEGLSHGLAIVTTEETGLADWLSAHAHAVVTDPASSPELAVAIVQLLDDDRAVDDVLQALPARDGRLAADDWMFSHALTISDLARVYT